MCVKNKEELRSLAKELISEVREQGHEFWIDPESHYRDHMQRTEWISEDYDDLRSIVRLFKVTRSLVGKAFIGLAIIGAGALVVMGISGK